MPSHPDRFELSCCLTAIILGMGLVALAFVGLLSRPATEEEHETNEWEAQEELAGVREKREALETELAGLKEEHERLVHQAAAAPRQRLGEVKDRIAQVEGEIQRTRRREQKLVGRRIFSWALSFAVVALVIFGVWYACYRYVKYRQTVD